MPGLILFGIFGLPPVAAVVTLVSFGVARMRAAARRLDAFLGDVTSLDPSLRSVDFRQG